MPQKISRDKNRITIIEYITKQIDEYGDAVDTFAFETLKEATDCACDNTWLAAVVEKTTSRYPAHLYDEPVTQKVVFYAGDQKALAAGGWLS